MARRRTASKTQKSHGAKASWRGMLQFGLVSISVEAVNAHLVSADHIAFHQLHASCHSRIRYEKTCPVHGPVGSEEIISGYEYAKDKYVEVDPEELDALRTQRERNLTIDAFVSPGDIDLLQFDGRMYYLVPAAESSREAYAVLVEALRRQERWGVGLIVMSGKEQPVIVRPYRTVLHMALLNYVAEMRPPASVLSQQMQISDSNKKLRLAEQLVENWSDSNFSYADYVDTYNTKIQRLIEAKIAGREIVSPAEPEEPPTVINLLEALRKSVSAREKKPSPQRSISPRTTQRKPVAKRRKKQHAAS